MKLGEAVYAQQQAQGAQGQPGAGAPPPPADNGSAKGNDDIIDAEVVE